MHFMRRPRARLTFLHNLYARRRSLEPRVHRRAARRYDYLREIRAGVHSGEVGEYNCLYVTNVEIIYGQVRGRYVVTCGVYDLRRAYGKPADKSDVLHYHP